MSDHWHPDDPAYHDLDDPVVDRYEPEPEEDRGPYDDEAREDLIEWLTTLEALVHEITGTTEREFSESKHTRAVLLANHLREHLADEIAAAASSAAEGCARAAALLLGTEPPTWARKPVTHEWGALGPHLEVRHARGWEVGAGFHYRIPGTAPWVAFVAVSRPIEPSEREEGSR